MTEAEWVACTDPEPMLEFVRNKASERKFLLYSVAASCRLWVFTTSLSLEEEMALADLIRDIFGNPFRPVTLTAAWQTPTVLALAQAADDDRTLPAETLDPARLAVLADALEEAGCDNADILSHCRQPGEHVRGCWVVDAILGKF
jgi:hypothetical protein